MRISVSNIGWPAARDDAAYGLLTRAGVSGLEVAPTRVWPEWQGISAESVRGFRRRVEGAGLEISSMQSILFQKPELELFGDGDDVGFGEHVRFCAELAGELGAKAVVFGAPKNRLRHGLTMEDAMERAAAIFRPLAEHYARAGTVLCMEANPEVYGCDFVTRGEEAAALVRAVDHAGFRLHVDTACARLAGESAGDLVSGHRDVLAHFHASQPMLGGFDAPGGEHVEAAEALRWTGYEGWVAVEMRTQEDVLGSLERSARFAVTTYGEGAR